MDERLEGERLRFPQEGERSSDERTCSACQLDDEIVTLYRIIAERDSRISSLYRTLTKRDQRRAHLEASIQSIERDLREVRTELDAQGEELSRRTQEVSRLHRRKASIEGQLASIYASRSWRITQPLRVLARGLRFRGALLNTRRALKLLGWLATGPFTRAGKALLPYYRRLPDPVKATIPGRVRRAAKQRLLPGTQEGAGPRKLMAQRLAYRDLLVRSMFKPVMHVPYDIQDGYFISFMNSYTKVRAQQYSTRPQEGLVSIIMPTFNRADCIQDAIRSVVAQSYTNWELIIVDDGSSDETASVVSSFRDDRIIYRRLDQNAGCAAARNIGLEVASGRYIAYLDSDNTMEPDFLLILVTTLDATPDVDVVYCAQRVFKATRNGERELCVRFAPFHWPSLANQNYIDLGTIMHRQTLVQQCGSFNAQMKRLVDWEFILRCTGSKGATAIPTILSNYYYGKDSHQITQVEPLETGWEWADVYVKSKPLSRELPGVTIKGSEQMCSLPYKIPVPDAGRPVSILIPSFEAEDYLRACVEAVQAFTDRHDYELIIVDNGSRTSITAYLQSLAEQGRARVLFNQANLGFSHAVNQGIETARSGNDIVILNNDAIVTKGWLGALQKVLGDYPDVGLVMPSQLVLGGEPTLPIHRPERNPQRQCDINISAHHANVIDPFFDVPRGYFELSFAPFFCVYVPRSTLALVGMLDVEEGPHYRSDRLYCDMVREHGKRILYTPHSRVYHLVQQATKELREQDPDGYRSMFVANDWRAIEAHAKEGRS